LSYAKKLLPRATLLSAIAFVGLLAAAPVVPAVLGGEYARTVEALRWLALLPVLKSTHYFLADSLTGAGYQAVRMGVQILVALVNVFMNLSLIPGYSWRGAAWSSIFSDALLAALLWAAITILRRREERMNPTPGEVSVATC
jgi:O-antigen/teichoic acid export membrane protein